MNGNKNNRGITLIELLVVMVIIAMFATIVGQRLFGTSRRPDKQPRKRRSTNLKACSTLSNWT